MMSIDWTTTQYNAVPEMTISRQGRCHILKSAMAMRLVTQAM